MKQNAVVAALRDHSEWQRSHGHADDADALLDVVDVYEANSHDYWATLSWVAKVRGDRDQEMAFMLARAQLRHCWKAPSGVADATMRKLYEQSEWERSCDRLEEGDAFLLVADAYERLGYDYRATLRTIADAQRKARGGGPLELAFALGWFRENWTEHTESAPAVETKPSPAGKARWPFGR